VIIWFRPEGVKPGFHQAQIKRLITLPAVTFPFVDHPESEVTPSSWSRCSTPLAGSSIGAPTSSRSTSALASFNPRGGGERRSRVHSSSTRYAPRLTRAMKGNPLAQAETTLITSRRNFLIRALGFTAAVAAVTVPIITVADLRDRCQFHAEALYRACQEYYAAST
jgi:hypothetical protein